jgi:hypothetical protein
MPILPEKSLRPVRAEGIKAGDDVLTIGMLDDLGRALFLGRQVRREDREVARDRQLGQGILHTWPVARRTLGCVGVMAATLTRIQRGDDSSLNGSSPSCGTQLAESSPGLRNVSRLVPTPR